MVFDKKEYHKKYAREHPEDIKRNSKKWRDNNKDKIKKYYPQEAEYKRTHRAKQNEQTKNWRKNNPQKVGEYTQRYKEKIKVQRIASKHIKIPEDQICQECNKRLAIHKHHEDYNKPLDVEFLCGICHSKRRFEKNGKSRKQSMDRKNTKEI